MYLIQENTQKIFSSGFMNISNFQFHKFKIKKEYFEIEMGLEVIQIKCFKPPNFLNDSSQNPNT